MSPAGSAQDGVRGMIAAAVLRARSRWQPSPVVLLVGLGSRDLLTDADAWLSASGRAGGRRARGVPHALVTVGPGHDDARALLDQAAQALDNPVGGPPLQLRRYDLVRLLLHQPPPATASRHVMRRWLRQQLGAMYSWVGPHPGQMAQSNPWWVTLGLWAAQRFTPSLRSIREVRWLLRQPYLDGARSDSLDHFVRHLTREAPIRTAEVDALLVHALLADLTAEYRAPLGRRGGRARTTLPVLLLPNADPGGPSAELAALVTRVRRDTGDGDPLLVLAQTTSPSTGPTAGRSLGLTLSGLPAPVQAAVPALDAWRVDRAQAGAALPADTAVLPLHVPNSPSGSAAPGSAAPGSAVSGAAGPPTVPPVLAPVPPWWARRGVAPTVVAAALLAGGGWLGTTWQPGLAAGCWSSPVHLPGSASADADAVDLRDAQCIGVSDRTPFGQGAEQNRIIVQRAIHDQNAALDPDRPVVSIVYLEQLTGPDDAQITPTQQAIQFGSEVEDLLGLWAAQVRARDLRSGPQLRVVIANAGRGMQHVGDVTDDILELRRHDPTVLAVVGGGESNRSTERAVERLSAAGLVVVAPILTTDGFAPGAQNYLQLSRPNADQALLMTRYLAELGSRSTVAVGYTDVEQDRYVQTLTDGVVASTRAAGGTATSIGTGDDLPLTDACTAGTTITYTGRWTLFNDFLGRLDQLPHTGCEGRRPLVVAGDSISSWVTSPYQRTLPAVRVPSLVYASNGVYCDTLDRTGDGEVLLDVLRRREPGLCRRVDPDSEPGSAGAAGTVGAADTARTATIGERQALAWDAALMVRAAVVGVQRESGDPGVLPSASAIVGQLTQTGYSGAAGRYDFAGRVAQRGLSLVCLPAPDASRVTVWTWAQMTAGAPIGRCSAP